MVQGLRRKKLGSSDIYVSEMGLGTQRALTTRHSEALFRLGKRRLQRPR